jgi:hypothetical protein
MTTGLKPAELFPAHSASRNPEPTEAFCRDSTHGGGPGRGCASLSNLERLEERTED